MITVLFIYHAVAWCFSSGMKHLIYLMMSVTTVVFGSIYYMDITGKTLSGVLYIITIFGMGGLFILGLINWISVLKANFIDKED